MKRRQFLKLVCAGGRAIRALAKAEGDGTLLYFVDGYHGGVRGHMPAGAWRDIMTRLDETPDWKLCLDIEPTSWKRLGETDPESLARIRQHLYTPKHSPRVEMVGGTFAQPYGWALSGESNIRQLVRGLEKIKQAFSDLKVETYAMQEPCWASCMPQILRSLGFRYAVLKNPSTAWGGYSVGVDAETVNWAGPDGTVIPTVTRYACEELLDTWRTEAQAGTKDFAEKCIRNGIAHPAGMCFQDLGWAARPSVEGDYLRFVTWREYMTSLIQRDERKKWSLGIEGIRCALPWGEQTLRSVAQQVRKTETGLSTAEKIASLAFVLSREEYPDMKLQAAEEQLLWSQHHDAWITATTRKGRDAWAFQVAAETWQADALIEEVVEDSLNSLSASANANATEHNNCVVVWNTQAHDRIGLVEIEIATEKGTASISVADEKGKTVPSQSQIIRKYAGEGADRVPKATLAQQIRSDESIGAARLVFPAKVPATGSSAYRLQMNVNTAEGEQAGITTQTIDGGAVVVESDLYRIRFDPEKGGTISSLLVKEVNAEYCAEGSRAFHEFRGYFVEERSWQSSATHPASLEIVEAGPVRARIAIKGFISKVPYQTTISIVQGQRRIDIQTQFHFEHDTWIGDPWEIKPEDRMKGRRRSEYDDSYKLLALFPLAFSASSIYKNAAFDVCKSDNANTFFNSWDTIKHNVIVNWVDAYDEKSDRGLALLSGHTTSYAHGEAHPLGLVLGWGWDGGFWWGKCPLKGVQQLTYAIIPHKGRWEQAKLWTEAEEWNEPLLARSLNDTPSLASRSLLEVEGGTLSLSSMTIRDGDLYVRFFNAESNQAEHIISIGFEPQQIERVQLDGTVMDRVAFHDEKTKRYRFPLNVPIRGLCTLRFSAGA
jgi:alpha-mannosidase